MTTHSEIQGNFEDSIYLNWSHMTIEELKKAMNSPAMANQLIKCVPLMDRTKFQAIVGLMTPSHIVSLVPSLELQQLESIIEFFSAEQIRVGINAITLFDRKLLLENISMLTNIQITSENVQEVQEIITYIDSLAIAVAVQDPHLLPIILKASPILTKKQIHVIVPLLEPSEIKTLLELSENDEKFSFIMQMLLPGIKIQIQQLSRNDFLSIKKNIQDYSNKLEQYSEELNQLESQVIKFGLDGDCNKSENNYQQILNSLLNYKNKIEDFKKSIQLVITQLNVAMKLIDDDPEILEIDVLAKKLNKQAHLLHQRLNKGNFIDGLIPILNSKKIAVPSNCQDQLGDEPLLTQENDFSLSLFEAVKTIGNPLAIGDVYNITWGDIINLGFRDTQDFVQKGIKNLKQLETFINNEKSK